MSVYKRLLIIFLWPLILEPGRGTVVVGRLGCSVSLPCHYKAFQVPLDKLYVYWQFKNSGPDKMAAVVIKGRINKTYQHGNYQGRGQMDPLKLKDGDFTFSLSSLTKGDEGIYHCIVMKDDVPMTTQYNISLRLRVDALFTVPTITRSGSDNRTRGSETTLICTSHGGLLRPRVWWVKSTDGSHLGSGQMLFKKHKDSWNVTSIITLNVTQSINLTCSVENPTGNITSPTYSVEIPFPNNSAFEQRNEIPQALVGTAPIFAVVVPLAAGLCIAKWKRYPTRQPEAEDNNEEVNLPLNT